jgi:hypothetical protein
MIKIGTKKPVGLVRKAIYFHLFFQIYPVIPYPQMAWLK